MTHRVFLRRFHRGMTPIRPSRPVYGYELNCTCGWHRQVNGQKREATSIAKHHEKAENSTTSTTTPEKQDEA